MSAPIIRYIIYMEEDGEITIIASATSKSKSLRTTIPAGIVRQFKLLEGSKLSWKIEARENNQLIIVVMPLKETPRSV
jgi:hypothetical protein